MTTVSPRPARVLRAALPVLIVGAAGACLEAPPATDARERVLVAEDACSNCIVIEAGPLLGDPSDPLPHTGPFVAGGAGLLASSGEVPVESYFVTSVAQGFSALGMYDANGQFTGLLGREGDGPGEFREPWIPFVDEDSLFVYDLPAARIEVFDPELAWVRRFPVPGGPFTFLDRHPDGSFLAGIQRIPDRGSALPLNLVSAEGSLVCTFGEDRVEDPPQRLLPLFNQRFARVDGEGRIWAVSPFTYELEHWDPCGEEPLMTLRREGPDIPDLTVDEAFIQDRERSAPPSPRIAGLGRDGSGLLWVLVRVPSRDWSAESTLDLSRASEAFDTVIEVIDPSTGRVRAITRTSLALLFAPDGTPHTLEGHPDGFVFARVHTLRLSDPDF